MEEPGYLIHKRCGPGISSVQLNPYFIVLFWLLILLLRCIVFNKHFQVACQLLWWWYILLDPFSSRNDVLGVSIT